MINYTEIIAEQKSFKLSTKNTITEDDLYSKLKQIKEVTNCNEEQGILILHDCNYNVEHAINKILTSNSQIDFEWKTKKGKQKKVQIKSKSMEKNDVNNNIKDGFNVNNKMTTEKVQLSVNEILSVKHLNQDSYNNGKTFRNYNLSKKYFSGNFCNDNEPLTDSFIIDLNCHWNGKSILIEHPDFSPMSLDTSSNIEIKNKAIEKSLPIKSDLLSKNDFSMDSSIMFKTHCSTKPPPKVQYSLAGPVQIMNKNISQRSMPKLKFGDTDFCDNSKMISLESSIKLTSSNNDLLSQPSIIDVEDNSIIKVGPSQKEYMEPTSTNFSINNNIYNQNTYFQTSLSSNTKMNEYQNCKSSDQYFEKFGYVNVHNQLPVSCNTGFPSLSTYGSTNINNIQDISNHSKATEVFLNQSQSSTYPSQSNIYIVPGMMMNSLNTVYMTVPNQLPTSALSPPMPPIPAQYKISQPQQHNQVYFNESHNQTDDNSNRTKRQYCQTRQQVSIDRSKKNYGDLSDELLTLKQVDGGLKGLSNFNPNQLSKQVPMNYPVFINQPQNRPQIVSNQFNHFSGHFPQQPQHELSSFENNRKRNMSIQNNHFSGQSW